MIKAKSPRLLLALVATLLVVIACGEDKDPVQPTNYAPSAPSGPTPANAATDQALSPQLTWQCSDPDGDPLQYDVFFGTTADPTTMVDSNLTTAACNQSGLSFSTTYYWKVRARDDHSHSTTGPVWSFTTGDNEPPTQPSSPSPPSGSVDQSITVAVNWGASTDPESDPVTYDVYFASVTPPTLVASNQTATSYDPPGSLNYGQTYYWQIVAKDDHGNQAQGTIWNFVTTDNRAPSTPATPTPSDGATSVSRTTQLGWAACTDPESDPVTYDVYFGTTTPPPSVATNRTQTSYNPGTLTFNQLYYWQIRAKDNHANVTAGAIWSFRTVVNQAPTAPTNPTPADDAVDVQTNQNLSWTASTDPEGDPVTYDVYFGTAASPPLVASNRTATTYNPGALNLTTHYYWKIVAKDDHTNATSSAVWDFHTRPGTWSTMTSPANTGDLRGVWGVSASDVFAVGSQGDGTGGVIIRYTGGNWTSFSDSKFDRWIGYSVWGTSSTNVWAGGGDFGLSGPWVSDVLHYTGTTWVEETSIPGGGFSVISDFYGPTATTIFGVGTWGGNYWYNGSTWTPFTISTDFQASGAWGNSSSNVYAVGSTIGGVAPFMGRYSGTSWASVTVPTSVVLKDVWGSSSSDIYAVGNTGTILRYNGSSWSTVTSPTSSTLNGLWGSSNSDYFAVGNGGVIVHYNGEQWTTMTSPTSSHLVGVWGASRTSVFAVGDDGIILRYAP